MTSLLWRLLFWFERVKPKIMFWYLVVTLGLLVLYFVLLGVYYALDGTTPP